MMLYDWIYHPETNTHILTHPNPKSFRQEWHRIEIKNELQFYRAYNRWWDTSVKACYGRYFDWQISFNKDETLTHEHAFKAIGEYLRLI